jgi:hypothetical protein
VGNMEPNPLNRPVATTLLQMLLLSTHLSMAPWGTLVLMANATRHLVPNISRA